MPPEDNDQHSNQPKTLPGIETFQERTYDRENSSPNQPETLTGIETFRASFQALLASETKLIKIRHKIKISHFATAMKIDKTNTLLSLILVTLLVNSFLVNNFFRPSKWEYRIEGMPDASVENELESLGEDGWEVASCRRAVSRATDKSVYECIFKRKN